MKHIDLSGQTILPGLIDMHVHLDSNPLYGGYTGLRFTDAFWAVQGVANARAMLEAGFTTVRNVGSENYADVAYKQAIEEGLMVGPRIVPAAHALGATGGHCDSTYGMTPIEAIRVATRNAAEALSRTADVGTLAVGRYGDIVAVTGDPLINVRLLEKPSAVIKGGVRIR